MTLKTKLQAHQVTAVEKLNKIKIAAMYMEQGTGKTLTALELIRQRLDTGKVDFVLWLCPCSVKSAIEKEIKKHVDGDFPVTIAGIESLSSSIRLNCKLLELVQQKQVYLIVDESNLVKNHRAQRTINIERLAGHCKYKLILNGTPISKCEKDLFAQWYILDWRILGYQSFWSFAANHLEYDDEKPGFIRRVLNVDYLVRKIAPYTYQVKKSECLTLPEKNYLSRGFPLTEWQRWHYEEVKDEFLMQLDEMNSTTIYRLFSALQHVASGNKIISKYREPIKTEQMFEAEDNPRIKRLLEIIPDGKVIIWCKYMHEILDVKKVLGEKFGSESIVEFHGEISKTKRAENIDKFSRDARFFLANKTCGGYGLNLQFCHNMIYYNNDFDWATRAQSEDRMHRIGQEEEVDIYDLYACSTIDERILKCLNKKERLSDSFKSHIDKTKNKENLRRWLDGAEDIQLQECSGGSTGTV